MSDAEAKLRRLLNYRPQLDSEPFYSERDPVITPQIILSALLRAREARSFAVSYRKFNVGAVVLATQSQPEVMSRFIGGVNIKPEEDSVINIHAEESATERAAYLGFSAVRLIAIVSETQDDQQSTKPMRTLHPCGLCRDDLDASPLIDTDQTLIATSLPDLRTIEFSTVNRLRAYHDEDKKEQVTCLELPDFRMLRTQELLRGLRANHTEETTQEIATWNTLIGQHLNYPLKAENCA